jgi:hypothetical protein
LAEKALNPKDSTLKEHIRALQDRFDAAKLRREKVHLREEARFQLALRAETAKALTCARENWTIQKEPWDARILLECALAARDASAAAEILAWLRQTRLQDPVIASLVAKAGQMNYKTQEASLK